MFEGGIEPDTAAARAVGLLRTAVDALTTLDLTMLDREALLGLARAVETQRCRLPVVDHRLVAELDSRGANSNPAMNVHVQTWSRYDTDLGTR